MADDARRQRERPFDIAARTFEFARDIVRAYPPRARYHAPSAQVWRQLICAASSVGANIEKARAASSRADFRFKVELALREAREAHYWLRLIRAARLTGHETALPFETEANELVAILTTIAKKASGPPVSDF